MVTKRTRRRRQRLLNLKSSTSHRHSAPEQTGTWRWVVELSVMSNNEEVVLHADRDISYEEFNDSDTRREPGGPFRSPMLVFSRPVFVAELKAGLDAGYHGNRYEEECPEITTLLDGLYRFFRDVEFRLHAWRNEAKSITNVISDIIAYSFYDCMSGGMDRTCVLACRAIIKKYGCDFDKPVYPGKTGSGRGEIAGMDATGWYTLGDWMRETERAGADEEFLREVGPLFEPLIQQKLLLSSEGRDSVRTPC